MNLYEGLFLTDAHLASSDWPALEKFIHDLLAKQGAEILYTEKWADRRLAYEVKGCKKGTYYLVYFNAPPEAIDLLNREIQLSEKILRVLFICENGLDAEMERRKNKEVEAPPVDLSADDRGFRASGRFRESGSRFGGGRRSRGDDDSRPARAPAGVGSRNSRPADSKAAASSSSESDD